MAAKDVTVGRQLEIVLNKYTSDPAKKIKLKGIAGDAAVTATEVVSLEERQRLANEYADLRAEVGLAPAKQGTLSS
jgi:hypothetical protein